MFAPDYSCIPPDFRNLKCISDVFLYSFRCLQVNILTDEEVSSLTFSVSLFHLELLNPITVSMK